MMRRFRTGGVARLYLGVLFAAMSVGQAVSWDVFVEAVDTYRVVSGAVLAPVLFSLQIVAAVGLLANPRLPRLRRGAAWVALTGAGLWTALAVQAFARGLVIPNCGCFGAHLVQTLNWTVLLQDVAFVGLALWHLRGTVRASRSTAPSVESTIPRQRVG